MKIEKVYKNIRYTLSNDNLKNGDKIFPIAHGRCTDDGWLLHDINFTSNLSGFPNDPHTILNLTYSDFKPYQVKTDHGYSPIECYYKIIKKEKQVKRVGKLFDTFEF